MTNKTLALTFDDGPSQDIMPRILELLDRYQANATFFIWGEKVTAGMEPLLRQAAQMGNELANHSMHHLHMSALDAREIRAEVEPVQKMLEAITGNAPAMFRPPYLDVSPLMRQVIPMPLIGGSDSRDWTPQTGTEERIHLVQEAAADGAIILMHCFEGNTATVNALEVLLPWFVQEGFRVTTVRELFAEKGVAPIAGQIYHAVPVC